MSIPDYLPAASAIASTSGMLVTIVVQSKRGIKRHREYVARMQNSQQDKLNLSEFSGADQEFLKRNLQLAGVDLTVKVAMPTNGPFADRYATEKERAEYEQWVKDNEELQKQKTAKIAKASDDWVDHVKQKTVQPLCPHCLTGSKDANVLKDWYQCQNCRLTFTARQSFEAREPRGAQGYRGAQGSQGYQGVERWTPKDSATLYTDSNGNRVEIRVELDLITGRNRTIRTLKCGKCGSLVGSIDTLIKECPKCAHQAIKESDLKIKEKYELHRKLMDMGHIMKYDHMGYDNFGYEDE